MTARLNHEFEMAKARATKEQLVEELMSKYREPLVWTEAAMGELLARYLSGLERPW